MVVAAAAAAATDDHAQQVDCIQVNHLEGQPNDGATLVRAASLSGLSNLKI